MCWHLRPGFLLFGRGEKCVVAWPESCPTVFLEALMAAKSRPKQRTPKTEACPDFFKERYEREKFLFL